MTSVSILVTPPADASHAPACLESLWKTLPSRFEGEVLAFGPSAAGPVPAHPFLGFLPPDDSVMGVAAARNVLVGVARSPLLLFLSPGTSLLPGWLPPMLDALGSAPRAGCIGNVQREPYSGLLDQAGLRFGGEGLPFSVAHGQPILPAAVRDRHPAVSLACALLRREVFDRTGGFDERFRGPLGDVDFCLRAAEAGYRHYVANRSVVYHDAGAVFDPSTQEDLACFRTRWGERARAALAHRAALRKTLSTASFSREAWEMAREDRRLQRQRVRDERRIGGTYLRKHLHRPWRYNAHRLGTALAKVLHPLPPTLPLTPGAPFDDADDLTRPDDGWLFDPPLQ